MSARTNILLLTLAVILTVAAAADPIKCGTKGETEIDTVVAKIMTIGTGRKYPQNKMEMKTYCKEDFALIARLEEYKNTCLDKSGKQIVGVIVYSIKSLINSYCKHPNARRTSELLASAECGNLASNDYQKCQVDYTERLMGSLAANQNPKQMLATMCCGYAKVANCIRDKGAAIKGCNEKLVDAHVTFNKGFFDNAVDVICGDYTENSDKCDKVKLPTLKKRAKMPKSFFNPLVKVLVNL